MGGIAGALRAALPSPLTPCKFPWEHSGLAPAHCLGVLAPWSSGPGHGFHRVGKAGIRKPLMEYGEEKARQSLLYHSSMCSFALLVESREKQKSMMMRFVPCLWQQAPKSQIWLFGAYFV